MIKISFKVSPFSVHTFVMNPIRSASWSLRLAGTIILTAISFLFKQPVFADFQQEMTLRGLVSMEAEHFHVNNAGVDHTWDVNVPTETYTGTGAMLSNPDISTATYMVDSQYVGNAPRLDYRINFKKTGRHYIWMKGRGGSGSNDSVHAGLDGVGVVFAQTMDGWAEISEFYWLSTRRGTYRAYVNVASTGTHVFNVWMREDGYALDKIVLTTDPTYTPQEDGPPESFEEDIDNHPPVSNNQGFTTDVNVPLSFTLAADDPDEDADNLSFNFLTLPTNGVLTGTAPNLTYTPNLDVTGRDTFVFNVEDPSGLVSSSYTVTLTIRASGTYLLDKMPGALAAYGLRRLSSTYGGNAIRVRRASNGNETDIGFIGDDLNITSLRSFCTGTNCTVTTWYDQAGSTNNFVQTDPAKQPKIVSTGTVIVDEINRPRIFFENTVPNTTSLATSSGPAIDNQNLTAFYLQQVVSGDDMPLFSQGDRFNHSSVYWTIGHVRIFQHAELHAVFEISPSLMPNFRTLLTLDLSGQTMRLFRNLFHVETNHHTMGKKVVAPVQIPSYNGYLSEVIYYPALSDVERTLVYDDVNAYYQFGPVNPNPDAILPQDWGWEVDLYNWLETVTVASVTIPRSKILWDRTASSLDALGDLAIWAQGAREHVNEGTGLVTSVIRGEPDWFVLDAGNGKGIEATGSIRLHKFGSSAAYFYSLSLPNFGAQGNPYFQHPGVGMRALVIAAVELMMEDKFRTGSTYWSAVDFTGGALNGYINAYRTCRHLLPTPVQKAFKQGFMKLAREMRANGPHGVNSNIDCHAIAALAHLYKIMDEANDAGDRDIIVQAAKKILFGSEFASPETTGGRGIYKKAGYIQEGGSPETTYNGASRYYLTEAYSVTRDEPAWRFMDTVTREMINFKLHQYVREPNGYWDGPSGYAGRTGGSYVYEQRGGQYWKDYVAADAFVEGRPLLGEYPATRLDDPGELTNTINIVFDNMNNRHTIDVEDTNQAPYWTHVHFPPENVYFPAHGWYTRLRPRIDAGDPSFQRPFLASADVNRNFDNEFWAFKKSDGKQKFGFFVESLANAGSYGGWYGGSLQTFWTEKGGIFMLARHDKSGNEPDQAENTRIWDENVAPGYLTGIDSWATHHVWGRAQNGNAFTTAVTNGNSHTVTYSGSAQYPAVTIQTVMRGGVRLGQETGSELVGNLNFSNRLEAMPTGVSLTHTITTDQKDKITEMWMTLPIFLRSKNMAIDSGAPVLPLPTTIEYWTGTGWLPVETTVIPTRMVRLTRDFGSGPEHALIVLDKIRNVKLSKQVWEQTYQGDSLIRNLHIDMHGTPGTLITMPALMTITATIQTTANWPGGNPVFVTAMAGSGGTVAPSGTVVVSQGTNLNFLMTPDPGFQIGEFKVDGLPMGPRPTYALTNIQVDHNLEIAFGPATAAPPHGLLKFKNFFNPTREEIILPFIANQDTNLRVDLYDSLGRPVATLFDGSIPAGATDIHWNGRNDSGQTVASGVYILYVKMGDQTRKEKIVVVK